MFRRKNASRTSSPDKVSCYGVYLVGDWDENAQNLPPAVRQVELYQTDQRHVAEVLAESWRYLAEDYFFPGWILCVDPQGTPVLPPQRTLPRGPWRGHASAGREMAAH